MSIGISPRAAYSSIYSDLSRYNLVLRIIFTSLILWSVGCGQAYGIAVVEDSLQVVGTDSAFMLLPELEVRSEAKSNVSRTKDGALKVNVKETLKLTRTLGEADLIASLRGLPGVEKGSDYGSGISVNGAEPSQTQYLLDGVPVIFPFRFGGVFSTFNAFHFSGLTFHRHSPVGLQSNLGGSVQLESADRFRTGVEGIVNLGLISSSATIRGGISDRLSLSLSGRVSYIDQIYRKLLEGEKNTLGFSFYDINASLAWRITNDDRLGISVFHSSDRVGYDDSNYGMKTRLRWHNTCGGVSFQHHGFVGVNTDAWITEFSDKLTLGMPQFSLCAPSSLVSGGVRCSLYGSLSRHFEQEWEAGGRIELGKTVPQWAVLEMSQTIPGIDNLFSERREQKIFSALAYGRWGIWFLKEKLKLDLSLSAGWFRSRKEGQGFWSAPLLIPVGKLRWFAGNYGEFELAVGRFEQYLHQIGFSELGLASDFIVGACPEAPLQKSFSIDFSWSRRLPFWGLNVAVAAYWSLVRNQSEYQGQVLEVIDEAYDPFLRIVVSDGHNEGINVALLRDFGSVNGEVSYGFGSGRRHLPGNSGESWRALRSPGHTFKASLTWHPGTRWTLSGIYNFSSGRVYTPVDALYLASGNIAMEYGQRNSARLPYYSRLDVGATYSFSSGKGLRRLRHLINFSLLNALGHRNVEMQYFLLNPDTGTYGLKRLYSLYRFIPSLSYTLEFK